MYYIADQFDHMWQRVLQAAFVGPHMPAWADLRKAAPVGLHMVAIAEPNMAASVFEPYNSLPPDSRLKQARNRLKEPSLAFAATFGWDRENHIVHIAPTLLWRYRPPSII